MASFLDSLHCSQWLYPGPKRVFTPEEMANAGQQPWPRAVDSYVAINVLLLLPDAGFTLLPLLQKIPPRRLEDFMPGPLRRALPSIAADLASVVRLKSSHPAADGSVRLLVALREITVPPEDIGAALRVVVCSRTAQSPRRNSTPENRSSRLSANRCDRCCWVAARMLTPRCDASVSAGASVASRSTQTSTIGGERLSEVKALTVIPWSVPAESLVVMMLTPLAS